MQMMRFSNEEDYSEIVSQFCGPLLIFTSGKLWEILNVSGFCVKKNGLWNLQIIIFINISHSVPTFLELGLKSLNVKEKALWARTAVEWCCCELALFAMKMNVSWKDNKRNSVAVSLCSICFLQVWMLLKLWRGSGSVNRLKQIWYNFAYKFASPWLLLPSLLCKVWGGWEKAGKGRAC